MCFEQNYLAIVKVILMSICLKLEFQLINVYVNVWLTYSECLQYTIGLLHIHVTMESQQFQWT